MKAIAAAALAGIAMASTPSLAADLFGTAAPPMSFPAENGPTAEVGSNWYIRGDIGAGLDTVPAVPSRPFPSRRRATPALRCRGNSGASQLSRNFLADVGVGYRFNNYFRVEATYEYRNGPGGRARIRSFAPTARTEMRRPGESDYRIWLPL